MEIHTAQIRKTERSKNRKIIQQGGLYITFCSEKPVDNGAVVQMKIDDFKYHFRVIEITADAFETDYIAREVGYWAKKLERKEGLELREVIGKELTLITNKDQLTAIREQSLWT